MYKKQTAVEWLIEQIRSEKYIEDIDFEQAKEMEKEQIMDAHGEDRAYLQDDGSWKEINGEQYYKENYEQ